MDKEHDHVGPWVLIALCLAALYVFLIVTLMWHEHRIDSAESRIVELEQRIECTAPLDLFFDPDGNEVCLESD